MYVIVICLVFSTFNVYVMLSAFLFCILQHFYIRTITQLKRIHSVRRSPVYAHLSESIAGTSSIRAYRQQDKFTDKNDMLVDDCNIAWYVIVICQRFLALFLDILAGFVLFFSATFAVIASDSISGGLAGLATSFAQQVSECHC